MKKLLINRPGRSFQVKMGRTRSPNPTPRLKLKNYLNLKALPSIPDQVSYATNAMALQALRMIYLNNQLGCCVISGGLHTKGVVSGNAGALKVFADQQVIQQYSAIGGYVPGDPSTDQGCNESDAIDYWLSTGFPDGMKLAGALSVDATDIETVRAVIYIFENVLYGMELPDKWVNPTPSQDGFIWDVAGPPDPENGHCVGGYGYGNGYIQIATWGMLGWITDAATKKYATPSAGGELHVLLSPDIISRATGLRSQRHCLGRLAGRPSIPRRKDREPCSFVSACDADAHTHADSCSDADAHACSRGFPATADRRSLRPGDPAGEGPPDGGVGPEHRQDGNRPAPVHAAHREVRPHAAAAGEGNGSPGDHQHPGRQLQHGCPGVAAVCRLHHARQGSDRQTAAPDLSLEEVTLAC